MAIFDPTDPLFVIVGKLIALCRKPSEPESARARYHAALRALDGARPASLAECPELWDVVLAYHDGILTALMRNPTISNATHEQAYMAAWALHRAPTHHPNASWYRSIVASAMRLRTYTIVRASNDYRPRRDDGTKSNAYGVLVSVDGGEPRWQGFTSEQAAREYYAMAGVEVADLAKLTPPAATVRPTPQKRTATLYLFRLLRLPTLDPDAAAREPTHDVVGGFVILAATQSSARACAANHCLDEGPDCWITEAQSLCDCLAAVTNAIPDRTALASTACERMEGDPADATVIMCDVA